MSNFAREGAAPPDAQTQLPSTTDSRLDLIKVGEFEQKHRHNPSSLTAEERAIRDAVLEHFGPWALHRATEAYREHLEQNVREHGGVVVRTRIRARDGHLTREVHRYPGRRSCRSASPQPRGLARPRGRRTSPGRARRARASSSSGSDPGGDDPEPPARRLYLVPPPPPKAALYSFACLSAEERGAA